MLTLVHAVPSHLLTFVLSCGKGYSTVHISSKRDKLSRICSGNGVLYVSIKSLGKAWAHRPRLYLDRRSLILLRTSADTTTADFEGREGAESEVGEKVTFKRGKMSGPGWKGEANGRVSVEAGQVQVGAKGRVFWLWLRGVIGKL